MGFFDKIKQKFSQAVEKTTETLKFDKLVQGLTKTRDSFVDKIQKCFRFR